MKMKKIIMMMAATAFLFGMSSCGGDDDAPEAPLAAKVVGSYTGNEIFVVDGDESSNETKTYQFTKVSDLSVDLQIPEVGMGMMTIPSFPIKGISLSKDGDIIIGKLASYEGSVKGADGSDKTYTITDMIALFSDKTVVVTYTMKYGRMPFPFVCTFTGTRK
jgi:hypothetical protein